MFPKYIYTNKKSSYSVQIDQNNFHNTYKKKFRYSWIIANQKMFLFCDVCREQRKYMHCAAPEFTCTRVILFLVYISSSIWIFGLAWCTTNKTCMRTDEILQTLTAIYTPKILAKVKEVIIFTKALRLVYYLTFDIELALYI